VSKRNQKRPKKPCPTCGALVRQLGKHRNQKHPATAIAGEGNPE